MPSIYINGFGIPYFGVPILGGIKLEAKMSGPF